MTETYTITVDEFGARSWRNAQGKLHRTGGPAVEWADGHRSWYVNGQLHRVDGPAVEFGADHRYWYMNGQLHREDGPAIEAPPGLRHWYLNGQQLTEQQWQARTQAQAPCEGKIEVIYGVEYRLTLNQDPSTLYSR
jgi:hypothetical protein